MKNINLLIAVVAIAIVALLVPGAQPAQSSTLGSWCGTPHDSCPVCSHIDNCLGGRYEYGNQYQFTCCLPVIDPKFNPHGDHTAYLIYRSYDRKYLCEITCIIPGGTTFSQNYTCDVSVPANGGGYSGESLTCPSN